MIKQLLPFVILVLTACGTDAPPPGELPRVCTAAQDGDSRCNDSRVEICTAGAWTTQMQCVAPQACGSVGAGSAVGCINPPGSCTYNGLTIAAMGALHTMDQAVHDFSRGVATSNDTATPAATDAFLFWENWHGAGWVMDPVRAGRTTPGSIPLDVENADYQTCALCLYGARGTGATQKLFQAQEGSFDITEITTSPGGQFTVTLSDVRMIESTFIFDPGAWDSLPVPRGDTWCLDNVTISSTNLAWLCTELSSDLLDSASMPVAGATTCFGGSNPATMTPARNPRIIQCNASGEGQFVMSCATDCSDDNMGAAACM